MSLGPEQGIVDEASPPKKQQREEDIRQKARPLGNGMTWTRLWRCNQVWVAETPSQELGQIPCMAHSQIEPTNSLHS